MQAEEKVEKAQNMLRHELARVQDMHEWWQVQFSLSGSLTPGDWKQPCTGFSTVSAQRSQLLGHSKPSVTVPG